MSIENLDRILNTVYIRVLKMDLIPLFGPYYLNIRIVRIIRTNTGITGLLCKGGKSVLVEYYRVFFFNLLQEWGQFGAYFGTSEVPKSFYVLPRLGANYL